MQASGGEITGTLTISEGGTVNLGSATINFDISTRTAADAALINNFALIQGTPAYHLTINANQQSGDYILANNVASDFNAFMTVGDGNPLAAEETAKYIVCNNTLEFNSANPGGT